MDTFVLEKIIDSAISVDIYKYVNEQMFLCLFVSVDGNKDVIEYSHKQQKEAIITNHYPFTDDLKNTVFNISFNMERNLGRYLFRKYTQDPYYRKIPKEVNDLIKYVFKFNLPVVIGQNIEQTEGGCEDASKVRKHLVNAQKYMPIFDELKSLVFQVGKKKICFVFTHCRGNRKIDRGKLRKFIKKTLNLSSKELRSIGMVTKDILSSKFGLRKGFVTPFVFNYKINADEQVIHVFDSDCLKSYGMPMMTNATHPDWATEFEGKELVEYLCKLFPMQFFVDQIVEHKPSDVLNLLSKYQSRTLGIIEYGLPSAILFRSKLNQFTQRYLEQLSEDTGTDNETIPLVYAGTLSEFPQYSISSPEWEKVMEPDLYDSLIRSKMSEKIKTLKNANCNIIAVPCNILPHYISSKQNFISIANAVQEKVLIQQGKGIVIGGKSVRNPARSIYLNMMDEEINKRLIYLTLEESEAIDEAMMSVNIELIKTANIKIFEVVSSYLGKIDFIIIASTSLSVFFEKQSKLIDSKYFDTQERFNIIKEINKLPIIDTLTTYAEFCANRLFE